MPLKYINEVLTTLYLMTAPTIEPPLPEVVVEEIVQEVEEVKPEYIQATFTNYVSWCEGCSGITASGYDVRKDIYYEGYRILAADKSIPFGTKYNVTLQSGQKFKAIVLDRGGVIKGNLYDLLVQSEEEALKFGRQKAKVEVIQ